MAKVTIPNSPWDYGPRMLASILPDPDHNVTMEFRKYLRKIDKLDVRGRELEKQAVNFCKLQGYTQNIEAAIEIEPETGKRKNPNNAMRRRKVNWIALMYKRGQLTDKQFMAAEKIQMAYEKLGRSPAAIKEINVDSSPKPDKNIDIIIDRISGFREVMRHVPKSSRVVMIRVVLDNRAIGTISRGKAHAKHLERLRVGLDCVYDAIYC